MFSNLESVMQANLKLHLARRLRKRKDESFTMSLAAAIYGSMRFAASRDAMKRIMAVEKTSTQHRAFATDIFQQMGNVQSLRDMFAHQSADRRGSGFPDEWTLCDVFTTKETAKVKTYAVHTDSIEMAALDAMEVASRLSTFEQTPVLFSGGDTSPFPWLYKPSMLRLLP